MGKLNVKAFTIAFGLCYAMYVLFLGWIAALGWGVKFVDLLSSVYIGYSPSFLGGIIGGIWAFLDGAVGAAIFALIYNALVGKNK